MSTLCEEIPPALDITQEEAQASPNLSLLSKLKNKHSSFTVLVRDVVVLTLFTEFMITCYRVGFFPHHTSWKAENYLIKLELIKLRNNSLHLNVADVERAELCIARYVQRSAYGSIYRKLSADTEVYQKTLTN